MTDRISDRDLYEELFSFNAWYNDPLDIDSLGAGGNKNHLIFFNTQNQLGVLMTNRELFDLIRSISDYLYKTGKQRKKPIKLWHDEYERIKTNVIKVDNLKYKRIPGGKLNHSFTYDLRKKLKPSIIDPIGSGFDFK